MGLIGLAWAWVLPGGLAAAWLALMVLRRRVGIGYYLLGAGLVVLCLPAALVASAAAPSCEGSREFVACGAGTAGLTVVLMVNGFLGFWSLCLLLLAGVAVDGVRAAVVDRSAGHARLGGN